MKHMVDIEVVIDESCTDPRVTIHTNARSERVDNIIEAVEKAAESDFPMIPCSDGDNVELISQRDIIRVFTEGRKILIRTEEKVYTVNRTLSGIEEVLNSDRFLRISQSEIINLYKVKCFDINTVGTIGIVFENGERTWVARSRVKAIKDMIKKSM